MSAILNRKRAKLQQAVTNVLLDPSQPNMYKLLEIFSDTTKSDNGLLWSEVYAAIEEAFRAAQKAIPEVPIYEG